MAAWADAFVTKVATPGILDVPTADSLGLGRAFGSLDLFTERGADGAWRVAPLPAAVVVGLPFGFDLGLALRLSGLPGDPDPLVPLLTTTVKFSFFGSRGFRPALAVAATFDRINWHVESSLRLIASTALLGPVQLSAFAGASIVEVDPSSIAPIGGLAVLVRLPAKVELFGEGLRAGQGWMIGAGVRWTPWKHLGLSASTTWKPGDLAPRVAISLAIFAGEPPKEEPEVQEQPPDTSEEVRLEEAQKKRGYRDPRPRFRLKVRSSGATGGAARHLQYEDETIPDEAPPSPESRPTGESPDSGTAP